MSGSSRVGFVANYRKTEFFAAVAEELERAGVETCWIAANDRLHAWLAERFGRDDVLLVDGRCADRPAPRRGDFKINELIYGDRALRHVPEFGRRYLTNIQQPLYEFLAAHHPRVVLGESTWAHEVLVHRLLRQTPELGCEYLCPATVRIPNGRFAFFRGEAQAQMLANPAADGDDPAAPSVVEKPAYAAMVSRQVAASRTLRQRFEKIKRFVTKENIVPHDPTLIQDDWVRFRLRVREEFNKEAYRFVPKCGLADLAAHPFVLVALHKQPEASIDVFGRYYEDQFQNIVNVWRACPDDWVVAVKEHASAVGDRGFGFYRELRKLPNLRLVDERIDSHELIRRAEAVVTVSGTVAYEAALMGRPALTLTAMYFSGGASCRHITLEDLRRCASLRELIPAAVEDAAPLREFVRRHSFAGLIADPLSDPRCMAPDNVRLVAQAVRRILAS